MAPTLDHCTRRKRATYEIMENKEVELHANASIAAIKHSVEHKETIPRHLIEPLSPIRVSHDFEAAKKRFAMYGKQNDHVSHYDSPTLQDRHILNDTRLSRSSSKRRRRAVNFSDDMKSNDNTTATSMATLKNTVLLQENGELAAQLDDVEYHVDGLVRAIERWQSLKSLNDGDHVIQTVVALIPLLQVEHVQVVMKVGLKDASSVYARVRSILLFLAIPSFKSLRLAIAVLAYFLTLTMDADEYFTSPVIDGLIECLKMEKSLEGASTETNDKSQNVASAAPLKKSFLKRKKSNLTPSPEKNRKTENTGVHNDLISLLNGHDAFLVEGQPRITLVDVIVNVLHNLLEIGSSRTKHKVSRAHLRHLHQRQDLAGATFALILERKRQLLSNDGLKTLVQVLEARFIHLDTGFLHDLLSPITFDCTIAFQRLRTMLRVLDQVSFLASDVQLYLSNNITIFRIVFHLVKILSDLMTSSQHKWRSDPTFMQMAVEVWMVALRVLINLSHHNNQAASYIASLDGTHILIEAFGKVWTSTQKASHDKIYVWMDDKLVFDAHLLLLSALTNCIEYSFENRYQLSHYKISSIPGTSSVCALVVAFFLDRIQSYTRLIELSESQDMAASALEEMKEASWVVEDVILGGCSSLLLGCLMKDSENSKKILHVLPDTSPRLLLRALSAFVALHSQIGALTPEVGQSVLQVEKILESYLVSDKPSQSSLHESVVSDVLQGWMVGEPTQTTSMEIVGDSDGEEQEEVKETSSPELLPRTTISKLHVRKFAKVCVSVDDSDEDKSEEDIGHRPISAPSSTSKLKSFDLTQTPPVSHPKTCRGTQSSAKRRLKRSRQLVNDLEAEFMKIGSRVGQEIVVAGGEGMSVSSLSTDADNEKDDGCLDFSQDASKDYSPLRKSAKQQSVVHNAHKRKIKTGALGSGKSKANQMINTSIYDFTE